MKILIVNKFLYPKGGSETYILKLGEILRSRGHTVQYFGLENEKNTVGNDTGSYVADMDFSAGTLKNLHAPLRIIYNGPARRKIRTVLDDFQPDVLHLNNIQYHLTPSIILEAEKYRRETGRKLRIVYTAHDYQLICPSHGLYDTDIHVCEKCIHGNYTHCLRTKCVKNSYAKSLLGMLDAYFWTVNKAYSYVDTIICCSSFLKSKLDTQPRFWNKTVMIRNFSQPVSRESTEKEDYVLEFGQLSRVKGTETLLEAAKRMPEVRFIFAGYGESVEKIESVPNAEYVGFRTGDDLKALISKARLSVCPSEIYENCPFSVIESQMYGTPVIGARIGGIPELITEGGTGELFEAGNVEELEQKLRKLLFTPSLAEHYSENCRHAEFETPDSYYEKLMAIYQGKT